MTEPKTYSEIEREIDDKWNADTDKWEQERERDPDVSHLDEEVQQTLGLIYFMMDKQLENYTKNNHEYWNTCRSMKIYDERLNQLAKTKYNHSFRMQLIKSDDQISADDAMDYIRKRMVQKGYKRKKK